MRRFQRNSAIWRLIHSRSWRALLLLIFSLNSTIHAALPHQAEFAKPSFQNGAQEEDARVAAKKLFDEGQKRLDAGAGSYGQAIEKFEEALPLWRKAGERYNEAITLGFIAQTYNALGEKQKAVDYFNQTLPLLREIREHLEEAIKLS